MRATRDWQGDGKAQPKIDPIARDLEALAAKIKDGSVVLRVTERTMLERVLDLVNESARPATTTRGKAR